MRKWAMAVSWLALMVPGVAIAAPAEPVDILEVMIRAPFVEPGAQLKDFPELVRVSACEIRNASLERATCAIMRGGSDVGTVYLSFGRTEEGEWIDMLPPEEQVTIVSECGSWDTTGCWATLEGYPFRTFRSKGSRDLVHIFFLTDVEFVDPPKD